jgi:ketosteroid isomerase-like protein
MDNNAEVVRRGYDAMRRRDTEALLEACDPDVELISLIAQLEGGHYVGHDGIGRFLEDMREAWDVWLPQEDTIETDGDTVLATGRTRLRGKGSGVEIDLDWGQVFTLRDGKVLWSRIYADRDEAREAFRERARV